MFDSSNQSRGSGHKYISMFHAPSEGPAGPLSFYAVADNYRLSRENKTKLFRMSRVPEIMI